MVTSNALIRPVLGFYAVAAVVAAGTAQWAPAAVIVAGAGAAHAAHRHARSVGPATPTP